MGPLPERDVHLGIATGRYRVHHGGDAFKMQLYLLPFCRAGQNDDSNRPACKVLLVANSPVRGEQEIHRRCLRRIQQGAVAQPVPASCLSGDDGVAGERAGKASWSPVVKENEH